MSLKLTRRRSIVLGLILALILVWLLWPDRSLAKARALRDELASGAVPPDVRDAKVKELRDTMQKMSPEQRSAMFADQRRRASEQMERYFEMSPAEKKKYLDQMIDRQQQFQQRMQQNGGGGPPAGFGGPPGGGN